MEKKIISALQIGSDSKGTSVTLDRILSFETDIKQLHCNLLVMPEALSCGY